MKRIFTKIFTNKDMREFNNSLDKLKLFWTGCFFSCVDHDEVLEINTGYMRISFNDFEIIRIRNEKALDSENKELIKVINPLWTNYVYEKQPSKERKRAYKEVYFQHLEQKNYKEREI